LFVIGNEKDERREMRRRIRRKLKINVAIKK
jgi:hypothetical protein